LETKEAASADVPVKSKPETSTANDNAAAMAIAGAPRTTMSLIAFLNNIMDFKACYNKSSIFSEGIIKETSLTIYKKRKDSQALASIYSYPEICITGYS
jgi:hypothetical protein